jgi:hypothetical protein
MSDNKDATNFRSVLKLLVLVFCGTQFPKLLQPFSLSSSAWYGAGVFIGLIIGFWLPPKDESMSFKK